MECFYIPELTYETKIVELSAEESKHAKVLRIKPLEKVSSTNGKGLFAFGTLLFQNKKFFYQPEEILQNYGEQGCSISLGFSLLLNKDRQEFILEKGTELGVTEFIPIIADNSQIKKFNLERAEMKIISAMKQTKRSCLPVISNPLKLKEMKFNEYSKIYLADINGSKKIREIQDKCLALVGPEGGFSVKELDFLNNNQNLELLNLGKSRLRAETAALNIISVIRYELLNSI